MPTPRLNILFAASILAALTGCASRKRPQPAVSTPQPTPIVFTEPFDHSAPSEPVARPGFHKAYFIGRIVDPHHPELMHGDGIVFRRERAETWNTATAAYAPGTFHAGPIRAMQNGTEHPTMTAADVEIHNARTNELVDALLAQNAELMDKLVALSTAPESEEQTATPPIALPAPSSAAAAPNSSAPARLRLAEHDPLVTIAPSADNIIELSPALLEPQVPGLTNPFRQRYLFETKLRETEIQLSGISLGPAPSCVIGDKLFNVGDTFESFAIASIDADGIFLRKESFLLRIPMQDDPITLRYP